MRVLITGSTGNVGREVVRNAVQRQADVRAAVFGEEVVSVEGVPGILFDFRTPATWPAALDGVDAIFLLRPPEMADVEQTLVPFLDAVKAQGSLHIVSLSLIGVDKNKKIPHYAVEQAVRASGLPWTFVRPGFFMQNTNTAYRDDIRFRNQIIVPAGKGSLSFIDVRDVGDVAAKALTESGHAGRIYSITGSESLNFTQVASILSDTLGRTITYARPSSRQFRRHQESLGATPDYIDVMNGIYFPVRMGWAGSTTDEFVPLMGRQPITFREYARDYAAQLGEPSDEERAAYEARLAAAPPPPCIGLFQRLRQTLSGPARIGA